MPELTEQDIADMKFDNLRQPKNISLRINTCEYGLIRVDGYRSDDGFKVDCVSVIKIPNEPNSEFLVSMSYVENNQESVRSYVQDNYEDKLVEACL